LDRNFLAAFAPRAKPEIVDALVSTGNYILLGFGINASPRRLATFLGQIAHETAGLTTLEENGNFSKAALLQQYSRLFDEQKAAEYAGHPDKILNRIRADRLGNGPEASGDGWKYRGRGFMQFAGKENYSRVAKEASVDILADPEIMSNPHVAMLLAAAYWYNSGLNKLADADDIQQITKKIVGGLSGLEERKRFTDTAFKLLSEKARSTP